MSPNRPDGFAPGQRRQLIVEAAGRLFGERGHDATTTQRRRGGGGVTKPVLYRDFADKTALYLALLERHREDLGSFAAAVPAAGSLEERLRAVLGVWVDYVAARAYAWRMLFRDTGGGPEIQAVRHAVHAVGTSRPRGRSSRRCARRRSRSASASRSPSA